MTESTLPTQRRRARWLRLPIVAALAVLIGFGGYVFYHRVLRGNFHVVVPEQVYRAAQPTGQGFRTWVDQYGIRSIINLRGGDTDKPIVQDVIAAADELGVDYHSLYLENYRHIPPEHLRLLIEMIEQSRQPMLLHCRSGADRSGLASAIAAMAIGQQSYEKAREHLSLKYLHMDPHPGHVTALLWHYEDWCEATGRPTAGWQQFRHWAMNIYGRDEAEAAAAPDAAPSGNPADASQEAAR